MRKEEKYVNDNNMIINKLESRSTKVIQPTYKKPTIMMVVKRIEWCEKR